MNVHPSHKTRVSMSASSYDEICEQCGATDGRGSDLLTKPCPNQSCQFDADYFLRGKQTGKSLYEDYRWLPDLTIPMVEAVVKHLSIRRSHTVLDFGCARGYVVRAFRELGYTAYGFDTSVWAIENADLGVYHYLTCSPDLALKVQYDWVIAKDVLEHVSELKATVDNLMDRARVGVFVVVPLSSVDGQQYVVEEYEKDVTHVHRLTLMSWMRMFVRPGWTLDVRYRVPGVKDNYYKPGWEMGNGFVTARRTQIC